MNAPLAALIIILSVTGLLAWGAGAPDPVQPVIKTIRKAVTGPPTDLCKIDPTYYGCPGAAR